MGDTWITLEDGKYVNLAAIACVEVTDDAVILYGGAPGKDAGIRVTNADTRRQVTAFLQAHRLKEGAFAAASSSRY